MANALSGARSGWVVFSVIAVVGFSLFAFANQVGPSTAVGFNEKGTSLTSESKAQLQELIREASKYGEIDEVRVVSWSDSSATPASHRLSKADRDLAQGRGEAVKSYLAGTLHISDVDTFNMADQKNWLARTLDAPDSQLRADVGRGGESSMSPDEFLVYKKRGSPSKAVVLVILKD